MSQEALKPFSNGVNLLRGVCTYTEYAVEDLQSPSKIPNGDFLYCQKSVLSPTSYIALQKLRDR